MQEKRHDCVVEMRLCFFFRKAGDYKMLFVATRKCRSTGKPTFALDGKPTPNQLTINQLKENQLKGASGEPPAPFGRYGNIFLSESEYTELKEEYPDRLERFIEEMSEYIAASGNDYVCHAAALRRWLNREKKEKQKKGIPDYSYKEGESL